MGILIAGVMALLCVLLHAEAMQLLQRLADRQRGMRRSLLILWLGLLVVHLVQIVLYAIAYELATLAELGELSPATGFMDTVYFSASVYTTVGFGDIVPMGALRIVSGSEGLVGLCLVAWSAALSYGHYQQHLARAAFR